MTTPHYGQHPAHQPSADQWPAHYSWSVAPGTGPAPLTAYPQRPCCEVCGAEPAAAVTIRSHQAFILFMRFFKYEGRYCRICATAILRSATAMTMALGWWGPLSLAIFNPFTLISNAVMYRRIKRLPAPTAWQPGRTPMDAGKPLVQRPLAYVALVPAVWAVWALISILTNPS